jgi:hypothetical protein
VRDTPYIDGYGSGQHDAVSWLDSGHTLAWFIESVQPRVWAWCLAHNLAIAGGLCRAFALGWDECVDATTCCGTYPGCGRVRLPAWAPGCGKAAP